MKNDKYNKVICQLIRSNYYADDLKALKLIYERLVIEGVIDEFQFDMELWNEFKEKIPFSHTSYLMYFKGKHPIKYTLYFHKIENSISTLVKS